MQQYQRTIQRAHAAGALAAARASVLGPGPARRAQLLASARVLFGLDTVHRAVHHAVAVARRTARIEAAPQ